MSRNSSPPERVGFAGTPIFAALILERLLASEFRPVVVYTQPDRASGRGRKVAPSPVKILALDHGIALRQPATLKDPDAVRELSSWNLDVFVVAAYGLILPSAVLSVPCYGCINVHASLLPRWRGAAPVERAIMAGDEISGVSIMQMDEGLDTGPVFSCVTSTIGADTTGAELEGTLAEQGGEALLTCLRSLPTLTPVAQQGSGARYADKLTPADAQIDWRADAAAIHRQIRALAGRIPTFTHIDDVRVRVLDAALDGAPTAAVPGEICAVTAAGIRVCCGHGSLLIRRLQLNRGKGRPLAAAEAINGFPELFATGRRLDGGT